GREGHGQLRGGSPVELRRPPRARSGPATEPSVRGLQQAGIDETIEMEGGQLAADPELVGGSFAPELACGNDELVQAPPIRFVERPQRREVVLHARIAKRCLDCHLQRTRISAGCRHHPTLTEICAITRLDAWSLPL